MREPDRAAPQWPAQDYADWHDTATTLHLWTQVVGKVRLALSPWINHGWQVPLYVNARGLGTSPIPAGNGILEIDFDFIAQRLHLRASDGGEHAFALEPMTVADFHRRVLEALAALGVKVEIDPTPNEVPSPIRFPEDTIHAAYDAAAARTFWAVLLQASGAASTSPPPASPAAARRPIRAASPACRTRSRARPTPTR